MLINQKTKGFTLLEMMLALLVFASIMIISFQQYQKYTLQKNLAAVEQNVTMLFQALDEYHAKLAADNPDINIDKEPINISNDLLQKNGYWPKNLLDSNLVADKNSAYVVEATDIKSNDQSIDNHNLVITLTLKQSLAENANWYATRLNASIDPTSKQLKWQKLPEFTVPKLDDNLWILSGNLKNFKDVEMHGVLVKFATNTTCNKLFFEVSHGESNYPPIIDCANGNTDTNAKCFIPFPILNKNAQPLGHIFVRFFCRPNESSPKTYNIITGKTYDGSKINVPATLPFRFEKNYSTTRHFTTLFYNDEAGIEHKEDYSYFYEHFGSICGCQSG